MKQIFRQVITFAFLSILPILNLNGQTTEIDGSWSSAIVGSCPSSGTAEIYTLQGAHLENTLDFHNEISTVMKFPSYYGKNLDALEEVLNEFYAGKPTVVFWKSHKTSSMLFPEYFEAILTVFADFSAQLPEHFCVILD